MDNERLKAKQRLAKALATRKDAIASSRRNFNNDNFAGNRGYNGPRVSPTHGYVEGNSNHAADQAYWENVRNPDYVISGSRWRKSPNADLKNHGK